jgi:putative ABC transport system permease protein
MDTLLRDIRIALRGLLRTPGFTVAAILALALGIGATTAIFSVVHAVLLSSLGWGEESRLVSIRGNFPGQSLLEIPVSAAEYYDLRRAPFLTITGLYANRTAAIQGERAERVKAGFATGSFFTAIGVQPGLGRVFNEDEDRQGGGDSVILSASAWKKRFAGDPQAIGRTLSVDGKPRTVVGVLPPGFRWEVENEIWLPFAFSPDELANQRGNRSYYPVARVAPGTTLESASRGLSQLSAEVRAANPNWYGHGPTSWYWTLTALRDRFVGSARQPLLVLLGAVLFVLLIACANVANLLLARGAARAREVAVRSALGASRGRLVRQLLTESALLAAAGAAGGILIAFWSLDALLVAAPEAIRQLSDVRVSWALLGFAATVTVLTTLFCGLAPALHATRADLADALKDGGRGSGGPRSGRLRSGLVVAQVALSLVLLIGAGLLLRSFAEVLRVDAGFTPEGVAAASVSLSGDAYGKGEAQIRYWDEAMRRAAALPGVQSAGAINVLPLQGRTDWSFKLEGYQPPTPDASPDDELRRAMPGYFETLRIPLRSGRTFTAADDAQAPYVVVVNESWARKYFPGQDVLGKRLRFGSEGQDAFSRWRTVVGLVADTHDFGLDRPAPPVYYLPQPQLPENEMVVLVRAQGASPSAVAQALRATLSSIDPAQPVDWAQALPERIDSALAPRRFPLQLLAAFAALALVLSALGIYGVTSYAVTQRTREIGVRIAIGAQARDVLGMVMGNALRLAGAGVLLGLFGALLFARVLSSQLFGVSGRDPLTYAAISVVLAGVALVASWLPARRATRVDPALALRAE